AFWSHNPPAQAMDTSALATGLLQMEPSSQLPVVNPQLAEMIPEAMPVTDLSSINAAFEDLLGNIQNVAGNVLGQAPSRESWAPWVIAALFGAAASELTRRQLRAAATSRSLLPSTLSRQSSWYRSSSKHAHQ